eukprot:9496505-Pyramimonas_sp.AAC.1
MDASRRGSLGTKILGGMTVLDLSTFEATNRSIAPGMDGGEAFQGIRPSQIAVSDPSKFDQSLCDKCNNHPAASLQAVGDERCAARAVSTLRNTRYMRCTRHRGAVSFFASRCDFPQTFAPACRLFAFFSAVLLRTLRGVARTVGGKTPIAPAVLPNGEAVGADTTRVFWLGCTGDAGESRFLAYESRADTWRTLPPPPVAACSGKVITGTSIGPQATTEWLRYYNFYMTANDADGAGTVYLLWRDQLAVRSRKRQLCDLM